MDRLEDALPLTAWYSDWKPAETLPLTSKHRGTNMKKFFIPLFLCPAFLLCFRRRRSDSCRNADEAQYGRSNAVLDLPRQHD